MQLWQITKNHIHLVHEEHGKHYIFDRQTGNEVNGRVRPLDRAMLDKCLSRANSEGLYTCKRLLEWQKERSLYNGRVPRQAWKKLSSMHYRLDERTGESEVGKEAIITVYVKTESGLFSRITISGYGLAERKYIFLEPIEKALYIAENLLKTELLIMMQIVESKISQI